VASNFNENVYAAATRVIRVTGANGAPLVSTTRTIATMSMKTDASLLLFSAASITDMDDSELTKVEVKIDLVDDTSTNPDVYKCEPQKDLLYVDQNKFNSLTSASDFGSITASWNAATCTLTLTPANGASAAIALFENASYNSLTD
jgi:hypothetical protein